MNIQHHCVTELVKYSGPDCPLIEIGSEVSKEVRLLLAHGRQSSHKGSGFSVLSYERFRCEGFGETDQRARGLRNGAGGRDRQRDGQFRAQDGATASRQEVF